METNQNTPAPEQPNNVIQPEAATQSGGSNNNDGGNNSMTGQVVGLIALLVIIIAVVAFVFMRSGDQGSVGDGIVSEFPRELVPANPNYIVMNSYVDRGQGDVTYVQPTVEFEVTQPIRATIAEVNMMLEDAGWTFTQKADPTVEQFPITTSAQNNDGDTLTVVFNMERSDVTVSMTLLTDVQDRCADGGCDEDEITDPEQIVFPEAEAGPENPEN